jgi:hypothetical protein
MLPRSAQMRLRNAPARSSPAMLRPNPAIYWRAPEHALHGLIRNSWSVHAQQHLSSLLDELENCS